MILSICIPSYNRFDILQDNLDSIFKAKSDDFEVVIVDNCSPVDICSALKCNDKRLRIIKRDVAIYGAKSVGTCSAYAEGKFALLCLDKDFIDGNYLDKFIETLKNNSEICGGYCQLDSAMEDVKFEICNNCCVSKFGYLCKHPSGDFFRVELLKKFYESTEEILLIDPFIFSIEMAFCAEQGPMMLYSTSLMYMARPYGSNLAKTLSFKRVDGTLYFYYENRMTQFQTYINHAEHLIKDFKDYKKTILRLYRMTIDNVTFGYNATISIPEVREHYYVDDEVISFWQYIKNIYLVDKILFKTGRIALMGKISMFCYGKLYFVYLGLKRFVLRHSTLKNIAKKLLGRKASV